MTKETIETIRFAIKLIFTGIMILAMFKDLVDHAIFMAMLLILLKLDEMSVDITINNIGVIPKITVDSEDK